MPPVSPLTRMVKPKVFAPYRVLGACVCHGITSDGWSQALLFSCCHSRTCSRTKQQGGECGAVENPSELVKKPGPVPTEVKGSRMLTITMLVPRPEAANLLIDQHEKCKKWQW